MTVLDLCPHPQHGSMYMFAHVQQVHTIAQWSPYGALFGDDNIHLFELKDCSKHNRTNLSLFPDWVWIAIYTYIYTHCAVKARPSTVYVFSHSSLHGIEPSENVTCTRLSMGKCTCT